METTQTMVASDHSEMSHQVAVLYPDNTTALYDGDHDMLPTENATGWNLTESTMSMNNISLNYSMHENGDIVMESMVLMP